MESQGVYFWLVCLVLLQGLLLGLGSLAHYASSVYISLSRAQWLVAQSVFAAGSMVYALVLVRNLVQAGKLEAEMQAQAAQMANIAELLQAMRAQRHDFVNHVQALYGLIKAGETDEAVRYITEVYGEVKQISSVLQVGVPALVSLLWAKTGEAVAKGVSFSLKVDPQFRSIPVEAKDLNRILGNLIDNALEAAEGSATGERWVEVELAAARGYYLIHVANSGEIAPEARRQLFRSGFSTKSAGRHQGLGLYSVQTLAARYGGLVRAESGSGRTFFTVTFPAEQSDVRRRSGGQHA